MHKLENKFKGKVVSLFCEPRHVKDTLLMTGPGLHDGACYVVSSNTGTSIGEAHFPWRTRSETLPCFIQVKEPVAVGGSRLLFRPRVEGGVSINVSGST